ncbi:MAG: cell division protein ZapA [Betaproteobacteria bacterium]
MTADRAAESLNLDVTIMGREYRVACKPEERQELLDAVAHVDRQMREIRDSARQNNAERVAVMAALNVTHELLKVRVSGSVDLGALKRRILAMQSTVDAALAEQEKLF